MDTKYTQYKTVELSCKDNFDEACTYALTMGWTPLGGVCTQLIKFKDDMTGEQISECWYTQAFVK